MSEPSPKRGEVWWVSLDPTQGAEIKKTRPCVILGGDTLNRLRRTVIVVPLSTAASPHPPITLQVTCKNKQVVAVIDQIRAVAKHRLSARLDVLSQKDMDSISTVVSTILEI
jgi:mRNA interferase MazF